jgi:hypothetical protein
VSRRRKNAEQSLVATEASSTLRFYPLPAAPCSPTHPSVVQPRAGEASLQLQRAIRLRQRAKLPSATEPSAKLAAADPAAEPTAAEPAATPALWVRPQASRPRHQGGCGEGVPLRRAGARADRGQDDDRPDTVERILKAGVGNRLIRVDIKYSSVCSPSPPPSP